MAKFCVNVAYVSGIATRSMHPPVAALLSWYIAGTAVQDRTPWNPVVTVFALAVTLGLATISFRYFEGPFLKWGQTFKYAPAPSAKTAEELPASGPVSANVPG
jgi:peptidoglycan/LPS O-acetylase OafA/YrhL